MSNFRRTGPVTSIEEQKENELIDALDNLFNGDRTLKSGLFLGEDYKNPKDGESVITNGGMQTIIGGKMSGTPSSVAVKLRAAFNGAITQYIVAGDSTRADDSSERYYNEILQQIGPNITYVDTENSGKRADQWVSESWGLQTAIDNTPGTGKGAILEYSLGLNDSYQGRSEDDYYTSIVEGVTKFLEAKPDAAVFFVTPVWDSSGYNDKLNSGMKRAADYFGFPLVDVSYATKMKDNDPKYYMDSVHQNWYGERRIINYIMNMVIPNDLAPYITLKERNAGISVAGGSELNSAPFYENGYYSTSTGGTRTDDGWRRTRKLPITGGRTVTYEDSSGTGSYVIGLFWNSGGTFIKSEWPKRVKDTNKLLVRVPEDATTIAFIVSSNAATWTPTNVSVKYTDNSTFHLTVDEINDGLPNKFKVSNINDGKFIDSIGSPGAAGNSLKANADGTYTWQA